MFKIKKQKESTAGKFTISDPKSKEDEPTGLEKKSKKKKSEQVKINPELAKQIHVMPSRFYVAPKKKRLGLIIIIVVGALLIGGLIALAIYLNQSLKQPATTPLNTNEEETNTNANENVNTNENTNVNENVNTNTNENVNINENTNVNENVNTNTNVNANTNVNVNANTNTNTNTNQSVNQPPPSAADKDNDKLTLAEESLYGTNPEVSDSDGDGFADGDELLNGYDPTRPQGNLSDSGLFENYSHSVYSIIYPKNWEIKEQDKEKNEVLFVSNIGEFIEVLLISNVNNLSLSDWHKQQFPNIDLADVTVVKINNLSGFRHPDNQSYYLVENNDTSRIFLLTHNIGNFTMTNFATTFQVIVKSFKLL